MGPRRPHCFPDLARRHEQGPVPSHSDGHDDNFGRTDLAKCALVDDVPRNMVGNRRKLILNDVEEIFKVTGKLSGLGQPSPGTYRNHKAKIGEGGYVGIHIGDVNIAFADEKGLVVAELFNGIVWGGIYLDKILNVHLNDSLYNDTRLRREHENTSLLPGRNYTELEHHWDLAYGYYQYWLPFVQAGGLPVLRESRIKIYNAFARGRLALTEYRYDEVQQQLQLIRTELSKVAAVRAMNLLVSDITLGNLDEDINNALVFLSQGCGAL